MRARRMPNQPVGAEAAIHGRSRGEAPLNENVSFDL